MRTSIVITVHKIVDGFNYSTQHCPINQSNNFEKYMANGQSNSIQRHTRSRCAGVGFDYCDRSINTIGLLF